MSLHPKILRPFTSPWPQPDAPHTAHIESHLNGQAHALHYAACLTTTHHAWPDKAKAPACGVSATEAAEYFYHDLAGQAPRLYLPWCGVSGQKRIQAAITIATSSKLQLRFQLKTYNTSLVLQDTGPLSPPAIASILPIDESRKPGVKPSGLLDKGWVGGLRTLTKTISVDSTTDGACLVAPFCQTDAETAAVDLSGTLYIYLLNIVMWGEAQDGVI
jgi:hypothetical protein